MTILHRCVIPFGALELVSTVNAIDLVRKTRVMMQKVNVSHGGETRFNMARKALPSIQLHGRWFIKDLRLRLCKGDIYEDGNVKK
jgi:hypothetical protein